MEPGDSYIYIEPGHFKNPNLYSMQNHFRQYIDGIYVSAGEIFDRIGRMAENILQDYQNQTIVILVVLRGAFRFAKDLVDAIDKRPHSNMAPYEMQFIRVRSYVNDQQNNEVEITGLNLEQINGKHVLVVEDLIDSGKSMQALYKYLEGYQPATLKLAVLTFKRNPVNPGVIPDYLGFSLPNEWIVGYHIDYNNYFRDLPHLAFINDRAKEELRLNERGR